MTSASTTRCAPIEPMFAMHKAVKAMMEIFMREGSTNAVADRLTSFEDFNRFVGLDKAIEEEARYNITSPQVR